MLLGYEGDGSVSDNPPVAVSSTGGDPLDPAALELRTNNTCSV